MTQQDVTAPSVITESAEIIHPERGSNITYKMEPLSELSTQENKQEVNP